MKAYRFFSMAVLAMMCFVAQQANAQQAKTVLDKAAATVGRSGGASASFTITSGKNASMSGKIAIKGNKFYADTPDVKVWYNGKTQWSYMTRTNEVNISTPTEAQQMAMNPYKFITMYKQGYKMDMKKSGTDYVVHLTAQDSKRPIPELYITVSKNYLPTRVRMRQGKTWSTITMSNFKAQDQSDATFTFNPKKYPNAEIIDLR